MKPDITIIIPVYNRENNITLALNSLLKQTYKNFEVIIIDDGSTDNSHETIKRYTSVDSRFKYYFQYNSGVSAARNKGIREATGKYITFLDSDDYYEHTFLEKMNHRIMKDDNDVCYCGYYRVTPQSKQKSFTRFIEGNILREYILGRVSIHTTGWMIKRNFILEKQIYFTEGVSWGEDIEYFCNILTATRKVCCVKDYLTNYTVDFSTDNLSIFSMDKIDKDKEYIDRIKKKTEILNNKNIRSALIDYRLSALITYKLISALSHKADRNEVVYYFNKYREYIVNFKFNNGFRSVKLFGYKLILFSHIYKINKFLSR
ncbi:MAG: glycosyltransferase family 2 protein [Bacillota bacterium]